MQQRRHRRQLIRKKRISFLQRKIDGAYRRAEARAEQLLSMEERRRARAINKELREKFEHAIRFDSKGLRGWRDAHQWIPSQLNSPLDDLIAKEEREERRADETLDYYQIHRRDARVEVKATDFEERRISGLIASAPPAKRKRGKSQAAITKYSPERGITQRHIKMSPGQYV